MDLCRQLALKINLVKQDFVFLGYHYDLASGMVRPLLRRVADIRAVIDEVLSNGP